jgi:hypothetical protein
VPKSDARATAGLRARNAHPSAAGNHDRPERGAVRDRLLPGMRGRFRSYGVLSGPRTQLQLVSLPPITEPQLKGLKHFEGEAQFTWTASATGERLARQWYPNERIVRALVEKDLLVGWCAAGSHRANKPPGCRHRVSLLGKAIVDCERGYAVSDDGLGGAAAVCGSDAAFRRAQADKVRCPWLRFDTVRWEGPDGACVRQAIWASKTSGDSGWLQS